MVQSATIAFLECNECGNVAMSFDSDRVVEKAEQHKDNYPSHELFLHTFESDTSRKL